MRVRALKQLKFSTSRGIVVIEEGKTFKPVDPQKLIDAGLAEPINKLFDPDDIESMFKILKMPLSEFKKAGLLVRVRCRHLGGEEVFLASTEKEAAIGRAEGLICYLPDEFPHLIKGKATLEEIRAVHLVKKGLGGRLIAAKELEVKA